MECHGNSASTIGTSCVNNEDGCQKVSASVETSCMKMEDGAEKASRNDDSFSVIAANGDKLNVCYF